MKNFTSMGGIVAGIMVITLILGTAIILDQPNESMENSTLKKFNTPEEITVFLQEQAERRYDYPEYGLEEAWATDSMSMEKGADAPVAGFTNPLSGNEADHSTTNVQVEGVDEADIVKTDGHFIYLISGSTLVIIDAYPAESAQIVAKRNIAGSPVELYIEGDRLVVFSTLQEEIYTSMKESVAPVPHWRQVTHAFTYSLSDRSSPSLIRDIVVTGNYYDSRLVDNYLYFITTDPAWISGDQVNLPAVENGEYKGAVPEIWYTDIPARSYIFNTLVSFNIMEDEKDPIEAETFLIGYGSTLYASRSHIYIAYHMTVPVLREPARTLIDEDAPDIVERPHDHTVIHRFAIHHGAIEYEATGSIPGYLLNQFAMDEYGGHLRAATTVEGWTRSGSFQYNNVYVLNKEMDTVGSLEYIAPDERIYSTRFVGTRLYMVTFKRIDPLFVIDLSNPQSPGILGKLKIPGYSDYLHPYDADHIIGIGKETEENQWGGVSVAGLKIAFFDVSDVNNPKLIDRVEIGEAGTDSEALYEHKAFLFDKEKDLLVIPVREVKRIPVIGGKYPSYSQSIWQGAYVFGLTPEDGFKLRGTISHDEDADPYRFWDAPSAVRRSLFIGDVLYTISQTKVLMNDLDDIATLINSIDLPSGGTSPFYPYPEPIQAFIE